jgi:hypothetical protein
VHDRLPDTATSTHDRVDDEYVFVAVAEDPTRGENCHVSHSLRVDPSEGPRGELVVQVIRRRECGSGDGTEHRETVTVSAPSVGRRPRARKLASVLESWYHEHRHPTRSNEGPSGDAAPRSPGSRPLSSDGGTNRCR